MRTLLLFLFTSFFLFADVGKITYIRGDVFYVRGNQIKPAVVGMKLLKKDTIKTKNDSMTKLLLSDKSAISLGSNTNFSIQDFLYDEKKNKAKIALQSNKGVFRIITGKISKVSPDRFKLKTKTLTIGIRGTIFSGEILKDEERIFCEKGRIFVQGKGVTQELAKGYKSIAKRGQAPSKPQPYKSSDLSNIRGQTTAWQDKSCEVNLDEL